MTKRAESNVTPIFCHVFKLWDENDQQGIVCVDPVMLCLQ